MLEYTLPSTAECARIREGKQRCRSVAKPLSHPTRLVNSSMSRIEVVRDELLHAVQRLLSRPLDDFRGDFSYGHLAVNMGNLTLSARTPVTWGEATLDIQGAMEFGITFPLRPFVRFVQQCRTDRLTIKPTPAALQLSTESARIELPGNSEAPWHTPSREGDVVAELSLDEADLHRVKRILYAAHPNDPILCGVRWGDGHVLTSDRYRLAMIDDPMSLASFIIPAQVWKHVIATAGGGVDLVIMEQIVLFKYQDTTLMSQRIAQQYVDYAGVVPDPSSFEHAVTFGTRELRDVVESVVWICTPSTQPLQIKKGRGVGRYTVALRSQTGRMERSIRGTGSIAEPILLDPNGFQDVLTHIRADTVTLELRSSTAPVVIRDLDAVHLVMPRVGGQAE